MKSYTRLSYNFLSDVGGGMQLSTEEILKMTKKQETCQIPCGKINAFFRTWLIYSCKGRCCPYSNKKCSSNDLPKSLTPIEFAFYSILGADYTDSTIRNVIRRLNRIRHIIKEEDNDFSSVYKDFTDSEGDIFKAVLSKNDNRNIQLQYQNIFNYYNQIIEKTNQELVDKFVEEMKSIISTYDSIDKFKNNVTDYVTKEFFFSNNDLIHLRTKALVIFYELSFRFFDIINIDIYKGNAVPDSKYITNFFYTEKVFETQDFIFILLNDHKNLVVYDINGKLRNEFPKSGNEYENQRLIELNRIRGIYLLRMDKKITSISQDHYNSIIKLEDGTYLINGTNFNHKIDSTENEWYFFYHKFNVIDSHDIIIKTVITKNFVIQFTSSGIVYFHGDNTDQTLAFNTSNSELVDYNVYIYDKENKHEDFFISENDKYLYAPTIKENDDSIVVTNQEKLITFDENELQLLDLSTLEKLDSILIEASPNKSLEIEKIIPLRNDAVLIECKETDGEKLWYRYFTYGSNTYSRLGYELNEDPVEAELEERDIHEITNDILINQNNEVDRTLRVEKVISYSKRILILNSGNVITASGENDGFFCEIPTKDSNEEDVVLKKFTRIVTNEDMTPIYDMVANADHSEKPIVLLYNNYRVYAFGSEYYRGFKNGGGFIENDISVVTKEADESLYRKTGPNMWSLFCTQRAMYSENPVFDIISNAFYSVSKESKISDFNCEKIKDTLNYLKDIIVSESDYESFDIKIRNIEDTSDYIRKLGTNPISGKISTYKTEDFSNYITNRYLLKEYINSLDYSYFAMLFNLIIMLAESKNYLRLIEVNEKGTMSKSEFEYSLKDINCDLPFDKEERINGYTKTIS